MKDISWSSEFSLINTIVQIDTIIGPVRYAELVLIQVSVIYTPSNTGKKIQENFNNSNTFGTMKICLRQG